MYHLNLVRGRDRLYIRGKLSSQRVVMQWTRLFRKFAESSFEEQDELM